MSDKKIYCPQCGARQSKDYQFCGICGAPLDTATSESEIQTSGWEQPLEQPPEQPLEQPPPTYQQPYRQPSYGYAGTYYHSEEEYKQRKIKEKMNLVLLFTVLSCCMGGFLWAILTIVFAIQARNLGSKDPKITWAIVISDLASILWIAVWFFWNFIWLFI
ncbi:MAG: zinc-ribbon domain-containing protein [Promethearchaeota archaeon]